jgi:uncharacterized membrane protein (UPF0127 family)
VKITINDIPIEVEVADTDESMAQGLQGRPSLSAGQGMLFDIGLVKDVSYHTRNCLFPMDIMFFGQGCRLKKLINSVQPEQEGLDCKGVRWVVETDGGWAKSNNIGQDSLLNVPSLSESIVASIIKIKQN